VEGPIQYDAAVDPVVAEAKMPGSPVAGQATVLKSNPALLGVDRLDETIDPEAFPIRAALPE